MSEKKRRGREEGRCWRGRGMRRERERKKREEDGREKGSVKERGEKSTKILYEGRWNIREEKRRRKGEIRKDKSSG